MARHPECRRLYVVRSERNTTPSYRLAQAMPGSKLTVGFCRLGSGSRQVQPPAASRCVGSSRWAIEAPVR